MVGGTARLYNTRAHGLEILKRSRETTFVQDALTYLVDVFGWFLEGVCPVDIYARGHGVVYREAGYDVDEVTWALVTFADGVMWLYFTGHFDTREMSGMRRSVP